MQLLAYPWSNAKINTAQNKYNVFPRYCLLVFVKNYIACLPNSKWGIAPQITICEMNRGRCKKKKREIGYWETLAIERDIDIWSKTLLLKIMNTFEDYPEVQSLIVRGFLSCECNPCAEVSTESNALVKISECTLHCHNARSILFVHVCNIATHVQWRWSLPPNGKMFVSLFHAP